MLCNCSGMQYLVGLAVGLAVGSCRSRRCAALATTCVAIGTCFTAKSYKAKLLSLQVGSDTDLLYDSAFRRRTSELCKACKSHTAGLAQAKSMCLAGESTICTMHNALRLNCEATDLLLVGRGRWLLL